MATPFLSSEEYDERAHQLYNEGQYDDALVVLRLRPREEVRRRKPASGEASKECPTIDVQLCLHDLPLFLEGSALLLLCSFPDGRGGCSRAAP